ncbi:MAG: putative bifunctional diguanylate cyclase/phosphodiesterase [Chloroflexota bacterium]
MHPGPTLNDVARDPILDGSDSLRLVRLRLALTLIAVAILPVVALAPLVRAVAEDARMDHHQRLQTEAGIAALVFDRELEAIHAMASDLLADPAIQAAASDTTTPEARAAAEAGLARLTMSASSAVSGAVVLRGSEVRASIGDPASVGTSAVPAAAVALAAPNARSAVADTATAAAPDGVPVAAVAPSTAFQLLPGGDGIEPAVLVRAGGVGDADPLAVQVVATVSLADLFAWAAPAAAVPGESLTLVTTSGTVLAAVRASFNPVALPGQVLDLVTQAARDSDGHETVDVDGLSDLSVIANAPIPVGAFPVSALLALLGLVLLLAGFTLWMARQIVRPAAQLEASRSRLRELYESAREAAIVDSLTGLGNHRAFHEALARLVEGSQRYKTAFALVLLDVDEFKTVNDTRGHAVGDQLLAQIGELIRLTIRQTDFGFRIGGDEFAVLLPHVDAEGAARVATRLLRRGLDGRSTGAYQAPISFSAGVTACPDLGSTRLELTAQADAALYRGKRTGRTVVTIYDAAIDHGYVDEGMRAELSSAISAVIASNALTPVYQPIIDLVTGRILGYEGLVRAPRESTFPNTGALFDAAEVAGRVSDLDRAALDVVLGGASAIPDDMSISLNISPRTMESVDFNANALLGILRRHGMNPRRVILELTEREAVSDIDRLRDAARGVREFGVRVAADDVGAGNAGLRLLSQLPFDVIKIDLSLVQGARQDQTLSVLTSLVEMAARWGAMTIAEGVETPAQLRIIRKLGISAAQGYLLGRPGVELDLAWVDLETLANDDAPGRRGSDYGAVGPYLGGAASDAEDQSVAAGLSPLRRRAMAFRKTSKVSNE